MGFGLSRDKSQAIKTALENMENNQNHTLDLSKPFLTQPASTSATRESTSSEKIGSPETSASSSSVPLRPLSRLRTRGVGLQDHQQPALATHRPAAGKKLHRPQRLQGPRAGQPPGSHQPGPQRQQHIRRGVQVSPAV